MLQQQTRPYEVLVRFAENGQTYAHYTVLDSIVDTSSGEVIGRPVERQEPITAAEAVSVIGENLAAVLQRVSFLESRLAELAPEETA